MAPTDINSLAIAAVAAVFTLMIAALIIARLAGGTSKWRVALIPLGVGVLFGVAWTAAFDWWATFEVAHEVDRYLDDIPVDLGRDALSSISPFLGALIPLLSLGPFVYALIVLIIALSCFVFFGRRGRTRKDWLLSGAAFLCGFSVVSQTYDLPFEKITVIGMIAAIIAFTIANAIFGAIAGSLLWTAKGPFAAVGRYFIALATVYVLRMLILILSQSLSFLAAFTGTFNLPVFDTHPFLLSVLLTLLLLVVLALPIAIIQYRKASKAARAQVD